MESCCTAWRSVRYSGNWLNLFFFLLFVVFVVLLSSFDLVLSLQFLNLYICMLVVPMFAVNI